MSNSLDLDQAQHFFGPDLDPNWLQRLSVDSDDISRQRDNLFSFFGCIVQSVTCLAADPGVASLILDQSHTFVD